MVDISKYPLGVQTFEKIRREESVYVDKTEYVYRLAHWSSTCFFLARPRRFGKSLFLSTLESYFQGKKELFRGLAIEKMEQKWESFPVLHFDISGGKDLSKTELEQFLNYQIDDVAELNGVKSVRVGLNNRMNELIRKVYEKTGKPVVVLVDEYDAPLLDVVDREDDLNEMRQLLLNFYSPLKSCDQYLRFVFLTGITKFSQMSIFSKLNNLTDISMMTDYAGVCGITKTELLRQLDDDIAYYAERTALSKKEAITTLERNYDGYHFCWPSDNVFNPYSLFRAFYEGATNPYWFDTGTSTYLIKALQKYNVKPTEVGYNVMLSDFNVPTESMTTAIPLLYQSGYITIKGYDSETLQYRLEIPNEEVKIGLYQSLLPYYIQDKTVETNCLLVKLANSFKKGDIDDVFRRLQIFLDTVPYCDNTKYEGHWQQVLYIIFTLMGQYVDVEVRTSRGRIDMVLKANNVLYIIELKLGGTAEAALQQVETNGYAKRFALTHLPIVKVGVVFDGLEGSIGEWKVAR